MTREAKFSGVLICLLLSLSAYYWQYRANSSGFHYSRVADLTYQLPDGEILIGFQSFYWDGLLLGLSSVITGLSPVDSIYLPYIFIISIPSVYLATKCFTDYQLAIFISFGIVIYTFSRYAHHAEYRLAMALYPSFIWAFYRYILSSDIRIGIIASGLILSVFLFGPPMGAWGVGALLVVTLGGWILQNKSAPRIPRRTVVVPVGLTAFVTIIFIWFNRKVWEQLPFRLLAIEIDHLFWSSGTEPVYAASSSSPEFLTWINIAWFLLATVPVVMGFIWVTYQRGYNPLTRDLDELYLLSVLIGCAGEIFVYLLIRGLNLRSVRLLSPIAAGYYIHKIAPKKFVMFFSIIFLSTALAFSGGTVAFDMDRPATSPENSQSAAEFVYKADSNVTTDHNTLGELKIGYALNNQNPRDLRWVRYNDDIAKMVFDGDQPPTDMSRLFVVNTKHIDYPLATGSDWSRYQAISDNYNRVENHTGLEKVYSSGSYDAYEVRHI